MSGPSIDTGAGSAALIVLLIYSRPVIVLHPWSHLQVATPASWPAFFEECRYEYRHGSLGYPLDPPLHGALDKVRYLRRTPLA